jgi:PAS domain-containing protein
MGDLQRSIANWQEAVRSGREYLCELRVFRRADQSYRWHLAHARPVLDERGRIAKWYGTATDIHDRKEMEEKLGRLARRFEFTLESITDVLITLDQGWRFTFANKATERLLGRPAADLPAPPISPSAMPMNRKFKSWHSTTP